MSIIKPLKIERQLTQWFEMVYNANFEHLYRYAFSITKNKQLAEDVVSEVFSSIWHKKPDYSHIQELRRTLFRPESHYSAT